MFQWTVVCCWFTKQARLRRRVLLQSGVRDRGRLAPSTQVAVAHHGHRGAMKDGSSGDGIDVGEVFDFVDHDC